MKYIFLFTIFLSFHISAEEILGKVVAVKDGDTVVIIDKNKKQYKVRLAEIDAPEKDQAFGQKSKDSLSSMIFGKEVTVQKINNDMYGRTVGKVFLDERSINVEQVKTGMAWVYIHYNKDLTLNSVESEARVKKIGLWIDKSPTPPWEWRKIQKPMNENKNRKINAIKTTTKSFSCGNKMTCKQMTSCEEAKFYLNQCGLKGIDGNHDGIPCVKICK